MYPNPTEEKQEIANIINRYVDEYDSSFRELASFSNSSVATFANWANAKHKPYPHTLCLELNHVKANTPAWFYGMYREMLDALYG